MNHIYLDNAATTRCYDAIIETMDKTMRDCWGNSSSLHSFGLQAEKGLNQARKQVADALKADPKEIYFTSGGTEGNNIAIQGIADAQKKQGNHIITSKIEHASVENTAVHLKNRGFMVDFVSAKQGHVDYDEIEQRITPQTILLSFMLVNNEIGTITDIVKIRDMLRRKNSKAILHCDAVQGFGKVKFNVKTLPADIITISGHKIHGPKGVGAMYIKKGTKINAITFGGGHESNIRPGTHNTPAIFGLAKACDICFAHLNQRIDKLEELNQYLQERLMRHPDVFQINTAGDSSPHILNISTPVKSEVMLHYLEGQGIYISVGSACSAKKTSATILSKAGFDNKTAQSAIRISLGDFNEKQDIDCLIEAMLKGIDTLFPL